MLDKSLLVLVQLLGKEERENRGEGNEGRTCDFMAHDDSNKMRFC